MSTAPPDGASPDGVSTGTGAADRRPGPLAVYLLFTPLWLLLMMGFAIGAPAWVDSWFAVVMLAASVYPVAVGVSVPLSRRAARAGRGRAALVWNLLPMPWVVAGCGFVVWALS